MLILTLIMQIYIVTGGSGYGESGFGKLASTEILEKDGGSAWQLVASLPSRTEGARGLGLSNGQFMLTGQ